MNAKEILRKLRFKAAETFSLVNAPCYMEEQLAAEAGEVHFEVQPQSSFTVLVIRDHQEFDEKFLKTIEAAKEDSLFWLIYPKLTGQFSLDVNRDTLWSAMQTMGYRPVMMIAVDKDWSAMRIRPAKA